MENNLNKIGILGGTFDPIHNGHIAIANAAKQQLNLDKVIFIPTGVSYMKTGVSANHFRYDMVKLVTETNSDFDISDVEIKREGNTYTCDTISYFKEEFPDSELYFIAGTDTLFMIEKWKNFVYLLENMNLVICSRSGENLEIEKQKAEELKSKYNANIVFTNFEPIDISSTQIRDMFRSKIIDNELISFYLPYNVSQYIINNHLYTD